MIALGVLLFFLAGVLVDWTTTGTLSPWDWAALIVLAVLKSISLTLRHREPKPERCPGCAHLPAWLSGCDECGGSGQIS